uniref:Derlin n=1 Tax=Vitis vinifera TaxID=29760 RepID=F6I2T3_VITVI
MKIEILNFSGSRGQLLGVYWSRHSRSSALVQVIVRENGRSEWWFQLSRKESPTLSFLYYRSLPPVSKVYGVACLLTTTAYYLQLYHPWNIALSYELVFKRFQVWRLVTNFFFLGPFSLSFALRLLIIARYGVSLERGPFDKRTADYVWMLISGALSLLVMAVVPYLWSWFMGASLVFMIVYVWGREFPNAQINFYGLVSFKSQIGGILGKGNPSELPSTAGSKCRSGFSGKKLSPEWESKEESIRSRNKHSHAAD